MWRFVRMSIQRYILSLILGSYALLLLVQLSIYKIEPLIFDKINLHAVARDFGVLLSLQENILKPKIFKVSPTSTFGQNLVNFYLSD